LLGGLVELTVGPSIRSWVGDKDDTTRLGLATSALAAAALVSAAMLARRRPTVGGRILIAVGLLVPALLCFTTVGRLWYVPGVMLLGSRGLAAAGVWAERGEVAVAVGRRWTAILTVLLAVFYIFLGATALGLAGLTGIAGGLLVVGLVPTRSVLP